MSGIVTGWRCPSCQTVYGPYVRRCVPCSPKLPLRVVITPTMPAHKREKLLKALREALTPDEVA